MKINVVGKITNGQMKGWYVIVKDDLINSGGYLVFYSPNEGFKGEGYDDWFETLSEAEQNFVFKNIFIEWDR